MPGAAGWVTAAGRRAFPGGLPHCIGRRGRGRPGRRSSGTSSRTAKHQALPSGSDRRGTSYNCPRTNTGCPVSLSGVGANSTPAVANAHFVPGPDLLVNEQLFACVVIGRRSPSGVAHFGGECCQESEFLLFYRSFSKFSLDRHDSCPIIHNVGPISSISAIAGNERAVLLLDQPGVRSTEGSVCRGLWALPGQRCGGIAVDNRRSRQPGRSAPQLARTGLRVVGDPTSVSGRRAQSIVDVPVEIDVFRERRGG